MLCIFYCKLQYLTWIVFLLITDSYWSDKYTAAQAEECYLVLMVHVWVTLWSTLNYTALYRAAERR